jgi:predicted RNA-binding protein
MNRKYWLDLFTGKTWEEFLKNDSKVSGFREGRKKAAEKIQIGDYLICYVIGISRLIGVLEVESECYFDDKNRIWEDTLFPVRFKVKPVCALDAINAIPIDLVFENLSSFKTLNSREAWGGFVRGSPREFDPKDAQLIIQMIESAKNHPVKREYDAKKYWRSPKAYESKAGMVTIPEGEEEEVDIIKPTFEKTTHEEIQYLLLKLGADLGLDVWVAKNDRNKEFNGIVFNDISNMRKELPIQFDEATNRTIELIDVLWLQEEAIMAAFEVEHTSSIYSGLLRMSDLKSMQPNINIPLYIVAPDERREKVVSEINRPTFIKIKPSLTKICKFIPYSILKKEIEQIGYRMRYMKPQFIDDIAETCETEEV